MKSYLVDTHVLLWMMEGNPHLSSAARAMILQAADQDGLFVSAITPWKIVLLVSKNRLTLQMDVQLWIENALSLPGIAVQPPTAPFAVASTRLPWEMHPDPADRILAATARHIGATLITVDQQMLQ